jgi:hypothetical protein
MLSKYIKRHQKDWDNHPDFIVMAYNATPHESTRLTPHRLVYGRQMTFPLDMISVFSLQRLNFCGLSRVPL